MVVDATLAKQALTKALSKSEVQNKPLNNGSGFKDVLNNMQSATDFADKLGLSNSGVDITGNMHTLSANEVAFDPTTSVAEVGEKGMSKKVVGMLSEVNSGQIQMDNMINQILYSDKKFNPQELLAIQAQVFHYARVTELTVKLAEHGVQSVKQVLNTQVQ